MPTEGTTFSYNTTRFSHRGPVEGLLIEDTKVSRRSSLRRPEDLLKEKYKVFSQKDIGSSYWRLEGLLIADCKVFLQKTKVPF